MDADFRHEMLKERVRSGHSIDVGYVASRKSMHEYAQGDMTLLGAALLGDLKYFLDNPFPDREYQLAVIMSLYRAYDSLWKEYKSKGKLMEHPEGETY